MALSTKARQSISGTSHETPNLQQRPRQLLKAKCLPGRDNCLIKMTSRRGSLLKNAANNCLCCKLKCFSTHKIAAGKVTFYPVNWGEYITSFQIVLNDI